MTYRSRFLLPALGQGDGSGRVVSWLKQPGERFAQDETLLEVETDKALVEVPAPTAGKLLEFIAAVDDTVDLDSPLAEVEFEGEPPQQATTPATRPDDSPLAAAAPETAPMPAAPATTRAAATPSAHSQPAGGRIFATPHARKLARQQGIDLAVLRGSGKGGRIVAADIRQAVDAGSTVDAARGVASVATVGVESREQYLPVGDGNVFAQTWLPAQRRSRATLFLAHGLFGAIDAWSASAALLARRGLPVVAMDLPCHGLTTSRATDFDTVVEVVADALRALVDGPVVLVGHSFGGAVCARLTATPGLDVSALGLIAPLGLGTEINTAFLDGMRGARGNEALRREMRKLTARAMPLGADYLSQMHTRMATQASDLAALCESVAAGGVQQVDIVPDLEAAAVPVTLIHGRADAIIPWQHVLNAPPATAVHLPAGVGHMPQWEASALTVDLLARLCHV